jgi:NAD(P)-dependent dehydrogenase (short-subunit alcohol dehydrogenase family)
MTPTEKPRIAVVTGAGSGIGRAVSRSLHLAGYGVVLAGRRQPALEETAAGSSGTAGLICVPTDVTDADSVAKLFAQAQREFGRVDLLFNNAGMTVPAVPLDELPVDELLAIVNVNLTGALLCAREALRIMKVQSPQGGHIINNGSVSSHAPRPNSAPYTATKHAITGLTKSIILDGRPCNIRGSQIDIGNAATEMSGYMESGAVQADGVTRPEPRFDVQHVARTVLHLAGLPPEANIPFVTVMATAMPLYGRG